MPEAERSSQSDARSTQDVAKTTPSGVCTKSVDEKTNLKQPELKANLLALTTAPATSTTKAETSMALSAYDDSKIAPMAKPESFADSLFHGEFETLGNNKQVQIKPDSPGKLDKPTEARINNKVETEAKRKDTLAVLIQQESVITSGVESSMPDELSSSPSDFSTIKVEAIIEPIPKSLQQQENGNFE